MQKSATATHQPQRRHLLASTLLLLGSGLLTGCQAMLFGGLNVTARAADVVVKHDIDFDSTNHLALDVYRPRDAHHAPVVVFFYGGPPACF